MMSVGIRVGRLCEVRFASPLDDDELTTFTLAIRNLVSTASEPVVFCCDWRAVERFEPAMLDTIVWIMRRDNPRIDHNAILVSSQNAELRRQTARIVAEAANPRRSVHDQKSGVRDALWPLLDVNERRRLAVFLDEDARAASDRGR